MGRNKTVIKIESEQALKVIENIESALFQAKVAIKYRADNQKEIERLKKVIVDRDKELQKVKQEHSKDHTRINILLPIYEKASGVKFELCPDCHGDGGFGHDDGHGEGEYEPCDTCKTNGYVSKEK